MHAAAAAAGFTSRDGVRSGIFPINDDGISHTASFLPLPGTLPAPESV